MVIIDTTVWIDFLKGIPTPHVTWLDRELSRQRLGLTDLILCEVLQGIRQETQFNQVKQELLQLEVFSIGGAEFAIKAAQNYRILRSNGFTVRKTIDCLIATFCIEYGYPLLHNDNDFNPFEKSLGLMVIHP
jgi:predicted nucleic acid-binding protein